MSRISAATLRSWLTDGDELALLDAREQGDFFDSHLFHAACIPLSRIEMLLGALVPRSSTRVVWCDDGERDLAERAATRCAEMGWTNVAVLDGGVRSWADDGGELYAGVNVPSKAFGEHVEHRFDTPRISASELNSMLEADHDLVVLDSRPMPEFKNMSIPTGVDCPGAELVHRVKEMVDNRDTLVVVNCAGRTRSIIGAQSLINAGLENRVVALENGTMGWELAGLKVARGHVDHAPDPGQKSQEWSTAAAKAVAQRFGVKEIDRAQLAEWQADGDRTTFLLDVRTPDEFADGHLQGSRNAPGGQLVQATDEFVATRNARIVLVDDNLVRATMTASWLRQLGWDDAVVLADGVGSDGLATGPVARPSAGSVPTMKVSELASKLADSDTDVAVLDIDSSLKYRNRGHIPSAWWGVRSRFDEAKKSIDDPTTLVLTSSDGLLAKFAVADAQAIWPRSQVLALAGGTKSWRHGGHDMETGFSNPTTQPNDVWYKPYDHGAEVAEQHMRDYLTWEIGLVEQLARDPLVSFPTFA
ncbi:MAG: rhodanese-like domain-containing protein [Acidimicrobiales bacterium]